MNVETTHTQYRISYGVLVSVVVFFVKFMISFSSMRLNIAYCFMFGTWGKRKNSSSTNNNVRQTVKRIHQALLFFVVVPNELSSFLNARAPEMKCSWRTKTNKHRNELIYRLIRRNFNQKIKKKKAHKRINAKQQQQQQQKNKREKYYALRELAHWFIKLGN